MSRLCNLSVSMLLFFVVLCESCNNSGIHRANTRTMGNLFNRIIEIERKIDRMKEQK